MFLSSEFLHVSFLGDLQTSRGLALTPLSDKISNVLLGRRVKDKRRCLYKIEN